MDIQDYIIEPYYGLIYHRDKVKQAEKYKIEDSRLIRQRTREVLAKSKSNLIDMIFIQPLHTYCMGDCVYCMNDSPHTKAKDVKFLSPDRVKNTLLYLKQHNYLGDHISISYTGGEPLLGGLLQPLTDTILDEIVDLSSIAVTTGMFYVNSTLQSLLWFDKFCIDKPIETICNSFTVDIDGSKNRFSKSLNITNEYNLNRLYEILPDVLAIPRMQCTINARLNQDTNLNVFLDNAYKLFNIDKNIIIRLAIIDGPSHFMEESLIEPFFTEIKKHFNVAFSHKGAFTVEITDKNSPYEFNNLMLLTLEDDIFILHPMDQRCWTWSKFFGISSTKYFGCYFGFYETENIEEAIVMTENNPYYLTYNKLADDCYTCELLPFCKLCPRQRVSYPCFKYPSMKTYMKEIFKIMISTPEQWCIE